MTRPCSLPECDANMRTRGLCEKHYARFRRNGDPRINGFERRAKELFWAKVEVGHPAGCWTWTGCCDANGYGSASFQGRVHGAHRLAYLFLIGQIPAGLHIDHLCRNPSCVNPDHLEPVTPRENVVRGVNPAAKNARKARCIRGHAFTPENTYLTRRAGKEPRRSCRTCVREQANRRYAERVDERIRFDATHVPADQVASPDQMEAAA